MKNALLLTLLAASLGLNAWLALARVSSHFAPDAARDGSTVTARATGARGSATDKPPAEAAPRPFIWDLRGESDDDLRALVANLRAAGFPSRLVARAVGTLLHERAYANVAALPFWQLSAQSREVRKLEVEAAREQQRLQEEFLGASGSVAATLDPTQRRERYGDLPDDKVAALLKIDRDYQDMAGDLAIRGALTQDEAQTMRAQFMALEKERLADIKAALGSEAYADYERQNSGAASLVLRGLRELKVTEEEYNALFAAQKAREPNESAVYSSNLVDPAKLAATYAFNDQVRAVLGDERAHTYLKSVDGVYGQIARFAERQQGLAPATVYQLYQLQNEAQAAMQQAMPRDGVSGPIDGEKLQQAFAQLNTRLDALVGPEVANAFRAQGAGSIFRSFAPRSTPSRSAAPASGGAATPPKG